MLFDAMVDRIVALFDADQPMAVSIVNERHKRIVGEAEFRLAETALGNTIAGQSDYALDDSIVRLRYLQLGADTEAYIRAGEMQMVDLRSGKAQVNDAPGAFSMYADAAGVEKIRIFPIPTVSGTALIGWTELEPADIVYGTAGALLPPVHIHPYILDGSIADGYEQVESRLDLAAPFEQRFEQGVVKLRRYKTTRTGSGQARVVRGW